jgi:hypothetical protein
MRKFIRDIINDLRKKEKPPLPEDLSNQTLSKDPQQRVRQLDYQAQKNEERQSS